MAIKPFVYVAAAGLTVGLLVFGGKELGRMADQNSSPVDVAPTAAASERAPSAPSDVASSAPPSGPAFVLPSIPPGPTPTATPTATAAPGDPIQVAGIKPPKIATGEGPFGSIVGTGSNTVALTFDDGPNPDWTPQILEVLRQSGIKATFCLIGENVEAHPDLVRAIVADGHTLCNHSWNHNLQLGQLSASAIRDDMQRASAAIEAAAPGSPISYFRAPGGNWTESIVDVARELGMTALDWTVDPRDWTIPPVASIVNTITNSCVTGAIFLLHDGGGNRANTVDAVRRFLPVLSRQNAFIALPAGGA